MRPLAALLLISLCACPGAPESGVDGRLLLEGDGDRPALDLPAQARVCERDSTLGIVATDGVWGAAIGARVAWPPADSSDLTVRARIDSLGRTSIAVREIGDTVSAALTADSGSLRLLRAGDLVAGAFEATAPRDSGGAAMIRGSFRDVRVRLGACP